MRVDCPKCLSEHARYSAEGYDIVHRCLCGFYKVVATKLGSIEIEHRDTGKAVSLPREGSRIWYCFRALVGLRQGTTLDIHNSMNCIMEEPQSMSEVSSQLTVLRYKGLVEVTENRKGTPGGSTWALTARGKELSSPS